MDSEFRAAFEALERKVDRNHHDIEDKFESYTHLWQFEPVKRIVYWMLGAFASGTVTVLVAIVVANVNSGGSP